MSKTTDDILNDVSRKNDLRAEYLENRGLGGFKESTTTDNLDSGAAARYAEMTKGVVREFTSDEAEIIRKEVRKEMFEWDLTEKDVNFAEKVNAGEIDRVLLESEEKFVKQYKTTERYISDILALPYHEKDFRNLRELIGSKSGVQVNQEPVTFTQSEGSIGIIKDLVNFVHAVHTQTLDDDYHDPDRTKLPTFAPSERRVSPTKSPTKSPTRSPSGVPSGLPSISPTVGEVITSSPSEAPSRTPTQSPTRLPTTFSPSHVPSAVTSVNPTENPTATSTGNPTATLTENPTATLTENPTAASTENPTAALTENPTAASTGNPTAASTGNPTAELTENPTAALTENPTAALTENPTAASTGNPTAASTGNPTAALIGNFTVGSTISPTPTISLTPTISPTDREIAGKEKDGLNTGMKVGIGFAGAALTTGLLAALDQLLLGGKVRKNIVKFAYGIFGLPNPYANASVAPEPEELPINQVRKNPTDLELVLQNTDKEVIKVDEIVVGSPRAVGLTPRGGERVAINLSDKSVGKGSRDIEG